MEVSPELLAAKGVASDRPYLASMGIYLFSKRVLLECLASDAIDFGHDIMPAAVAPYRVQAHFFNGYWRDIGTIRAFFDAHMDLVDDAPNFSFHDPAWPFYTRPRYLPGALLSGCRFDHALLAEGTRLRDSEISHSVIGLRTSATGCRISRSLVMGVDSYVPDAPPGSPPVGIGEGSEICGAIIDKNAHIGRNVRIVNQRGLTEHEGDDWAIREGIVVIPKNSVVPDGTVI